MRSVAAELGLGPAGSIPAGPRRRWRPAGAGTVDRQRGMVTAELAFASIGAALACVALAWVLALVALFLRCQDTAAEVARQEARADHAAVRTAIADRPEGARVSVSSHGEQVTVRVDLAARPWLAWLPTVPLSASATVLREPA